MTDSKGILKGCQMPTGVALIPDDVADGWEAAKALHAEAVAALQKWDPKIRAYLGANLLGIRADGRMVVTVKVSKLETRMVEGKTRRDLQLPSKATP
jgi:phage baseplate assembly protein W